MRRAFRSETNSTILSFTLLFRIGRDPGLTKCSDFEQFAQFSQVTHRKGDDALDRGLLFRETQLMRRWRSEDNVWIGTGARILPGVSSEPTPSVGAGSVVIRSLSGGVVAAGDPGQGSFGGWRMPPSPKV